MAIFREFNSSNGSHRAAEDRRRHKELVEDKIKKNIADIIAEESIIGQSKGKKVKIPLKGMKEYRFIHGSNNKGVGSGTGNEEVGDIVGEEKPQKGKGKGQAGNDEGEDYIETEVTIEELINYLFDDLELPDLDRKKLSDIDDISIKKLGYQKKGIQPRLAKKQSVINKIKRTQGVKRSLQELGQDVPEDMRIPFNEDDLRYYRMREVPEKRYNAVIFCIMDVSGSMDTTKKYLARSFYFFLYQFIKLKYETVEVVFVAHTTTAKEVSEKEFFYKGESGGTYISSGYEKVLDIIKERYAPSKWNIYAFHCSDGDNWSEDDKKAVKLAKELSSIANLMGYIEILSNYYYGDSVMSKLYNSSSMPDNFTSVQIKSKDEVLPALKKSLSKED